MKNIILFKLSYLKYFNNGRLVKVNMNNMNSV